MLNARGNTVRQRDESRPVRCGMVTDEGACGMAVVRIERSVCWAGKIAVKWVDMCPRCEGAAIRQLAEAGRKMVEQGVRA